MTATESRPPINRAVIFSLAIALIGFAVAALSAIIFIETSRYVPFWWVFMFCFPVWASIVGLGSSIYGLFRIARSEGSERGFAIGILGGLFSLALVGVWAYSVYLMFGLSIVAG